jgi:hypothetical protein
LVPSAGEHSDRSFEIGFQQTPEALRSLQKAEI